MATAAPAMEIAFGKGWMPSLTKLSPADAHRALQAVEKFSTNPAHPGLNFEKLNAGDGHLWSIRATKSVRIIIWREGPLAVLLEAGPHDIYDELERGRFVYNPETGFIGVIDVERLEIGKPEGAVIRFVTPLPDDARPGVFDIWSDAELREAGFSDDAIAALRRCTVEEELLEIGLTGDEFDRAVEIMELTPEQWRAPALLGDTGFAEERLRRAVKEFGALHGLSQFYSPEEVAKIAAAPIEEWMIFLHPDQRAIVGRRFEGPARIRGAAGTGKTVVALHRVAELARRFGDADERPILFTTFIRTLPPVFEGLYKRLPNAPEGRVEFVNVDKLARAVLRSDGQRPTVETRAINAAWTAARKRVLTDSSALRKAQLSPQYLREEITSVVKGRGISSLDDYLHLERTGRVVPFSEPLRRELWLLKEAWDEEMAKRGTIDFADVLLQARDVARRRPEPTYRAAIVDESQDLTLVGLQLIRALVNGPHGDQPDGLLLVGDGAQRIYPGGFTLRQAGIEVTGRSTVLRANYRNTAEILAAAMAVAGDERVEDLGEEFVRGSVDAAAVRTSGTRPLLVECAGADDEAAFLLRRVNELVADDAIGYGDIGVFGPTNRDVERLIGVMDKAGIPRQDLTSFDGLAADAVKVGTYHRAKGLEFKVVFLPGLDHRFPRPPTAGQDQQEYEEERSLAIASLFVAMTRARDVLVLTAPGTPSSVLSDHLEVFDVVDS